MGEWRGGAGRVRAGVAGRVGLGAWGPGGGPGWAGWGRVGYGVAGRVGRWVGWYGPVAVKVYTARKGVCNGGVANALQSGWNRVGRAELG